MKKNDDRGLYLCLCMWVCVCVSCVFAKVNHSSLLASRNSLFFFNLLLSY